MTDDWGYRDLSKLAERAERRGNHQVADLLQRAARLRLEAAEFAADADRERWDPITRIGRALRRVLRW